MVIITNLLVFVLSYYVYAIICQSQRWISHHLIYAPNMQVVTVLRTKITIIFLSTELRLIYDSRDPSFFFNGSSRISKLTWSFFSVYFTKLFGAQPGISSEGSIAIFEQKKVYETLRITDDKEASTSKEKRLTQQSTLSAWTYKPNLLLQLSSKEKKLTQ